MLGGLWEGVAAGPEQQSLAQRAGFTLMLRGLCGGRATGKVTMDAKEKAGPGEGSASAVVVMIWICFSSSVSNLF